MCEEIQSKARRKKVLVVDDDDDDLVLCAAALEEEEDWLELITLDSGTNIVTFLQKEKPDLVILDFGMPIRDGAELIEEVRKHEELRSIPFIIHTGSKIPAHRITSICPICVILKPDTFDFSELKEAVRRALNN